MKPRFQAALWALAGCAGILLGGCMLGPGPTALRRGETRIAYAAPDERIWLGVLDIVSEPYARGIIGALTVQKVDWENKTVHAKWMGSRSSEWVVISVKSVGEEKCEVEVIEKMLAPTRKRSHRDWTGEIVARLLDLHFKRATPQPPA